MRSAREGLKDKESAVRYASAAILAELGQEATSAVPHLQAALGDKSLEVKIRAADALAEISGKGKELTLAFIKTMASAEEKIHCRMITEIGRCPRLSRFALPYFLQTYSKHQGNRKITYAVVQALRSMGPAAKEGLPVLHKELNSDYRYIREVAAEAIERITGKKPDEARKVGSNPF